MYRNFILPVGLIAGTIIGAGVFSLPYVIAQTGTLAGIFYLLLFGGIVTIIHLMYADITLRAEDHHRFVGYANKYLGSWGRYSAIVTILFGLLFTLTIYLVLSLSFANILFPDIADEYKLLAFWLLGSLAIFWSINGLAVGELVITVGIVAIIIIMAGYGSPNIEKITLLPLFEYAYWLVPLGPILFSLIGRVAIPPVVGYFRKNNLDMGGLRRVIVTGTFVPVVIYAIFIVGVISLSGTVSQDSITGILGTIPDWLMACLGILGILTLWSSYIVIGRDLQKSLDYDFQFPKLINRFIVIGFPIILYYSGFKNFLDLVAIVGSVFVGLEALFVIAMWRKARKEPSGGPIMLPALSKVIQIIIVLVFVFGVVYEIVK